MARRTVDLVIEQVAARRPTPHNGLYYFQSDAAHGYLCVESCALSVRRKYGVPSNVAILCIGEVAAGLWPGIFWRTYQISDVRVLGGVGQ